MRFWRRGGKTRAAARTVAQAAASGAPRDELIRAAMEDLKNSLNADRVAVWLKDPTAEDEFRGTVWDATQQAVPAEWSRISPQIALFLRRIATSRQEGESSLDIAPGAPILGPLLEMQRALWVPVERQGQWMGLLLAASRRRNARFSRNFMDSIAAELALALALEEEKSVARDRLTDLVFTRKVLVAIASHSPTEETLSMLAEDCTVSAGAAFAAIGRCSMDREAAPQFEWRSGDTGAGVFLGDDFLGSLWREALSTGRAVGANASGPLLRAGVSRVAAIPLKSEGKTLGVLVVGLSPGQTLLGTMERLEVRAALAARVLAQSAQQDRDARSSARTLTFLRKQAEALLLLDADGTVLDRSEGARNLLGPTAGSSARVPFFDLFRENAEVTKWWQRVPTGDESRMDPIEAELFNGIRVRLQPPLPVGDAQFAVALGEVPVGSTSGGDASAEVELRALLEWLEQGVVLIDAEQRVRAMNTRFLDMAGISPQEAARISTLDALATRLAENAAESSELAERWREAARAGESGVREEIHLVRPTPRILERAARPVIDSAGRRVGWLEIYRDLTAQRVFQSKLLQTEKLAALGQMVTGVAHELSNPLTSILGYAQRLLVRDESGAAEEIRQIFQEAERASRILRQLLQSGGDARPERRPVSLNHIVLRALDLQRFSLSPERFRLEKHLDPDLPQVLGDADQLQQVVMNLLSNARQAIEQGSGRGTIRLETARTPDRRVRLEVSDDGPGIPPSILPRIFDPFFTTKPAGVGTGLGLPIVLGIVREHGGQVTAANRSGGGALFTVELPAHTQQRPRVPTPESERPGAPAAPVSKRTRVDAATQPAVRVLIVEDEPTVARLIADVLEDEGFAADILLDGREALQRASRQHYDLLICDLKMPGLNGQHFYQALVQMGSPLRERAIFVTGDALSASTLEFLERNRVPYVAKPFRVEELIQAVRGTLGKRISANSKSAVVRNP